MNFSTLIRALRAGQSVQNPTGWKYAQIVAALAVAALGFAQSRGWLQGVEVGDVLALVSILIGYLSVATTDKIGVLPACKPTASVVRDDRPVPPLDYAPVRSGAADPGQAADEFWGSSHGPLDEH